MPSALLSDDPASGGADDAEQEELLAGRAPFLKAKLTGFQAWCAPTRSTSATTWRASSKGVARLKRWPAWPTPIPGILLVPLGAHAPTATRREMRVIGVEAQQTSTLRSRSLSEFY